MNWINWIGVVSLSLACFIAIMTLFYQLNNNHIYLGLVNLILGLNNLRSVN